MDRIEDGDLNGGLRPYLPVLNFDSYSLSKTTYCLMGT